MKFHFTHLHTISMIIFFMAMVRFGSYAQCNGDITLSTQAEVNAFDCSTVTGNLTISGENINNLNPIFNGNTLTSVTGEVAVLNCPNLSSLEGLHGITSCGGFFVSNCLNMSSLGHFEYELQNVVDQFYFNKTSIGSFNLNNGSPAFPNLTTCNEFNIFLNNALLSIDFGALNEVSSFNISGNNILTSISGFNALTSVGTFSIITSNLTSITGFDNLNQVNNFGLILNDFLNEVSAFENLNVSGNVQIIQNPQLFACCFAEHMLGTNNGNDVVSGNAIGCNSFAEIMAPPVFTCPPNSTVNTSATTCGESVSFTDPPITDNCGIDTYTALITLGDGTVFFDGAAVPGVTFTYQLTVGNNTFEFSATDTGGNTTSCSTTVTVVDNVPPVFPSPGASITGICGVDDPSTLFFANPPTATDNCGIAFYNDPFTDVPGCGSSFIRTYTTTATDVNGNTATFITTINMVDNTPPVLSGIPDDITIFCADPMPSLPTITAEDQCAGNVTSSITVASSVSPGNCTFNTPGEITTFSWTATDGCGNNTTEEWTVTRINDFEFTLGDNVSVCNAANYTISAPAGGSYLWSSGATTQSITVNTSGNYTVTITNAGGCCNSDMINVTFGTSPNASATGAQLDCSGTAVTIMGSSTSSGVTYSWTGPGGFTSMLQNPSVNVAGTYTLTVTNGQGCTSTATATVTTNTSVPNVSATGGTITCTTTSVTLMGMSTTSGVTYAWTGPGGFTSMLQNPTVSTPGTYNLVVTAPNSCIANATAEVINNTTQPTTSLSAPPITCTTPTVTITNTASSNAATYAWTGPGGYTSTVQSPMVSVGGVYNLIVTATNGCTNTNAIGVILDNAPPNATATGANLNCNSTSVLIMGASTTPNVSYSWTGPNGFTSGLQSPQVSFAGTYTLTVTGQNGCTSTATAVVVADANAPVVTTTGGSITCTVTSVTLMATSSIAGSTFVWSGPSGFTSTEQNPVVTVPGNYTVIVTAPNNCKTTSATIVNNDTSVPSLSIALGTVDCTASTRLLNGTTNVANPTMTWTGPNGFTFTGINPSISLAGTYMASVTGTNGCVNSATITIDHNIAFTTNIVTTDATPTTLGTAAITINGGTPNFNIVWDNGVTGTTNTSLIAGNHNVTVVDGLGCTKVIPFVVGGPVSTKEEDKLAQAFVINPNPTIEHIKIVSTYTQKISYSIINHLGQVIRPSALYNDGIDVSHLNAGIYYVRINVDDKYVSKKFVKI